jgi:hypothetical protein
MIKVLIDAFEPKSASENFKYAGSYCADSVYLKWCNNRNFQKLPKTTPERPVYDTFEAHYDRISRKVEPGKPVNQFQSAIPNPKLKWGGARWLAPSASSPRTASSQTAVRFPTTAIACRDLVFLDVGSIPNSCPVMLSCGLKMLPEDKID